MFKKILLLSFVLCTLTASAFGEVTEFKDFSIDISKPYAIREFPTGINSKDGDGSTVVIYNEKTPKLGISLSVEKNPIDIKALVSELQRAYNATAEEENGVFTMEFSSDNTICFAKAYRQNDKIVLIILSDNSSEELHNIMDTIVIK